MKSFVRYFYFQMLLSFYFLPIIAIKIRLILDQANIFLLKNTYLQIKTGFAFWTMQLLASSWRAGSRWLWRNWIPFFKDTWIHIFLFSDQRWKFRYLWLILTCILLCICKLVLSLRQWKIAGIHIFCRILKWTLMQLIRLLLF